ncbi:MAG: hypothetical protein KF770_24585 [Anaerolineae bacterium]|nr:hypothetical protein [Anaerolineae bacterium]
MFIHQAIREVVQKANHTVQNISLLSGYLLLITTWSVIFILLAAFTEGWLAPWDTRPFRPPEGTWERTVNDFFEGSPGSLLPASLIVTMSIAAYLYGKVKKQSEDANLTWGFAILNLLFIVLIVPLSAWARQLPYKWLPQSSSTMNFGYQFTWLAITTITIMAITLIATQILMVLRQTKNADQ